MAWLFNLALRDDTTVVSRPIGGDEAAEAEQCFELELFNLEDNEPNKTLLLLDSTDDDSLSCFVYSFVAIIFGILSPFFDPEIGESHRAVPTVTITFGISFVFDDLTCELLEGTAEASNAFPFVTITLGI